MKVLHVIPSVSPSRGGPSKAVTEMALAMIKEGADIEIATTNDDSAHLLDVPLNCLTDYQQVPTRFFKRFSPPLHALREFGFSNSFRKWLKKNIHHYDVIHIHAIFSFTSSYAMFLSRKRGVPYIVRPIGQLEQWALSQSKTRKKLFLALFEKRSIQSASYIHFTAKSEMEQALLAIPELKEKNSGRVIPLGICSNTTIVGSRDKLIEKYKLKNDKKIALYLSRLHPKKGLEILFSALSQISSSPDPKVNNWQLLVAGDGSPDYIRQLKQETNKLNIAKHCHFIGFASGDEKQLLLQGADVFVLTSFSENFGIAVLEALAANTPAVVSREVALSTTIEKHQLGYVCELETESIKSTLLDAFDENNHTTINPKEFIQTHYNWQSIANEIRLIYEKLAIK